MVLKHKIGPAVITIVADGSPHDEPHPWCGPFAYDGTQAPSVTIRIRTDPPSPRGNASWISELSTQWSLYTQEQRLRLEILEQIKFLTKQVAEINQSFDQVDLHLIPLAHELHGVPESGWYLGSAMEPLVQWWLTGWLAVRAQGMILHGAAVSLDGHGLAFIGPSGAGKTTIARWCRDEGNARVLNDERIVLWQDKQGWWVSGTPWYGELRQVSSLVVPLAQLYFLRKADVNRFLPLPPAKVLTHLISEAFLPIWTPEGMEGLVKAGEKLSREIPTGKLNFVNDPSVVNYLRELLRTPSGIAAMGVT